MKTTSPSETAELGLLVTVLGVLWSNGNAKGHETFPLLPQLLDWLLFFLLAAVLMSNFLRTAAGFDSWAWPTRAATAGAEAHQAISVSRITLTKG